jgi:probable rRNA maturation factor
VLHLLGYDHADAEEHKEMFDLQGEMLSSWHASRSAGGS